MKIRKLFIALFAALALPVGAFAMVSISAPTVIDAPSSIDADTTTLTIQTQPGAKITVVGGSAFLPPVTDGEGSDEEDGMVEIEVGLAQEALNTFSITAELDGEVSEAAYIEIQEKTQSSTQKGDKTPPEAPELDDYPEETSAAEVRLSGSSESEANITAYNTTGDIVGGTRANALGIFNINVDLEPGKTNRINIKAEDAAGNEGSAVQAVIRSTATSQEQEQEQEQSQEQEQEQESTTEADQLPFDDTKGHWSEKYVKNLYDKGVVNGKDEDTFDPNGLITRAELAKIVVNAFDYPLADDIPHFPDVAANAWYATYVETAFQNGITGGYSDGTFKPNKTVNRAEALKFITVAADVDLGTSVSTFADVSANDWFNAYVAFAQQNNVVGGYDDNTFRPGNFITRAEVAKIITKILELTQ